MNPTLAASPHAVRSDHDLDANHLVSEIETTLTDLGVWTSNAQTHERIQRAEWEGQSEDGRKWAKNYGKDVFPWEGAADTRHRLADMSIGELVHLKMVAFFNGEMRTVAMEANDADAAGRVNTLLHYELKQRLYADLWQELNFACTWSETYGHAVLGTFWENAWTTGLQRITVEDLAAVLATRQMEAAQLEAEAMGVPVEDAAAMMPEVTDPQMLVEQFLMDRENGEDELVSLLRELYPTLPEARARKVIKRLRAGQTDEFRIPIKKGGRPKVKAYMPGFDVFYPWATDNVKSAPWVAVQDMLWLPDLLAKETEEGWDKAFIDAVVAAGTGPVIEQSGLDNRLATVTEANAGNLFEGRGASERAQRARETQPLQYGVLRVYVRTTDEDGVPALREIVMKPSISKTDGSKPGLVGLNRVLDYYHDHGCFVSLRREYYVRSLWESRGVGELAMTPQAEMKARRDSHMDRVALNTLPPSRGSVQYAPGSGQRYEALGIKPGGFVADPRGATPTDFMRLPGYEPNEVVEKLIDRDNARLLGLLHPELPQEKSQLHRQWIVNGFLVQVRELVLKILSLDQQFLDPLQVSRIIGSGEVPFVVSREEIAGQYDVLMTFDVRSMDMAWLKQKLAVLQEAVKFDRSGAFKDVPVMRYLVASVDPNLADLAIADVQAARESEIEDEKKALGTLMTGIEVKPPDGSNAAARLETDQAELANNPRVYQAYQTDLQFRAMLDARMAKWQFDLTQQQNAQTGRSGWKPTEMNEETLMGDVA